MMHTNVASARLCSMNRLGGVCLFIHKTQNRRARRCDGRRYIIIIIITKRSRLRDAAAVVVPLRQRAATRLSPALRTGDWWNGWKHMATPECK